MSRNPDQLSHASTEALIDAEPWKVLIADDDEQIQQVTRLALRGLTVLDRPIKLLVAKSGAEAVEVMQRESDIALVLMDVVMETEHAGLEAVEAIRNRLNNKHVRIVLRTGQPGQAPELQVVRDYDINDYKEKTELTMTRLYTVMQTGLRQYRELVALDRNRAGLESVIEASANIHNAQSLVAFQRGVLEQVAALLYARRDAVLLNASGVAAEMDDGDHLKVSAGTGAYRGSEGLPAQQVLEPVALERIRKAVASRTFDIGATHFAAYFATRGGAGYAVYLSSLTRFTAGDAKLIELFCRNVAIALDNLLLHHDLIESQRQLILLLSAGIEERSTDLHNHVKRVSEYARLLGRLAGLPDEDVETVGIAAALHDLGKISIPDAILNKPGVLTDDERAKMEKHVEIGKRMLEGQKTPLLKTAEAVVAGHHEHWDGRGYPGRLAGEQVPLFARITALCDVFDALSTRRVYKDAWPVEDVVGYLKEHSGSQFEPRLVELVLKNLDAFLKIRERFPSDASP